VDDLSTLKFSSYHEEDYEHPMLDLSSSTVKPERLEVLEKDIILDYKIY